MEIASSNIAPQSALTGRAKSNANLRPARKGDVRNPLGRQKGLNLKTRLINFLEEPNPDDPKGRLRVEVFIQAVWAHAIKGDAAFARLILERVCPVETMATLNVNMMTSDEHRDVLNRLRHGETVIRFNGNGNGHATDRVLPSAN